MIPDDSEYQKKLGIEWVTSKTGELKGIGFPGQKITDEQKKFTSSFRLLTQKPKLIVINLADDDDKPERPIGVELVAALLLALALGPVHPEQRTGLVDLHGDPAVPDAVAHEEA